MIQYDSRCVEQSRDALYCGSVAGDEAVPLKGQRAVWEDSLVEKQLEGMKRTRTRGNREGRSEVGQPPWS